jgi:hypothetical protein
MEVGLGPNEGCSAKGRRRKMFTTLISIRVKVKFSLYLTNRAVRHEDVWGSGCFLDLGTSRK